MIRYTPEEKEFLKAYCPGHHYREIVAEFSERFRPITENQVKAFLGNNKIKTGTKGRFRKGFTPWNKGERYIAGGRSAETQFKKGNMPKSHKPVGTTRISKDGYLEKKIGEPNKWEYAHRIVWEEAHGKIPEGHIVVFRDGNKQNLSLDNLACISRAVSMQLNRYNLQNSGELFDTAVKLTELMKKQREVKHGNNAAKRAVDS